MDTFVDTKITGIKSSTNATKRRGSHGSPGKTTDYETSRFSSRFMGGRNSPADIQRATTEASRRIVEMLKELPKSVTKNDGTIM